MRKRKIDPSLPTCKYNHSKTCGVPYELSCHNGGYCSNNPNRFNGREVTKGQILFLVKWGVPKKEAEQMDFNEASEKIKEIKHSKPVGTFKTWGTL